MYMAPIKELLQVRKQHALGELNPLQFPLQCFNCCAWVIYSFFSRNIFLFFSSGPGSVLGLWAMCVHLAGGLWVKRSAYSGP